jgi:hypothetical protein
VEEETRKGGKNEKDEERQGRRKTGVGRHRRLMRRGK